MVLLYYYYYYYYYYYVSIGTYGLSNLYKGFPRTALSFSPLCGLLIGHEVVCVVESLLVLPRWQEIAADRRVLLKQPQLLFLISFCFASLVHMPYIGSTLCISLYVANLASVSRDTVISVYEFWSHRSFQCIISYTVVRKM